MTPLLETLLRHAASVRPCLVGDGPIISYRELYASAAALRTTWRPLHAALPMRADAASIVELLSAFMARVPLHLLPHNLPPAQMARKMASIERAGEGAPPDPDVAVIQETSGTTGRPKTVARTHASLGAELAACRGVFGYRPEDLIFCPAPFHHAYGLVDGLLCALDAGASLLLSEPAFTRRGFERLAEHPVTVLVASPPFLRHLLKHVAAHGNPFPALRMATSAGCAPGDDLVRDFRAAFGFALTNIYGMTELGTALVSAPGVDPLGGMAGRPLPGYETRFFDVEGDMVLGILKPGEDFSRLPEEVRSSQVRDGFFLTGDAGRIVDGTVFLTGRATDFINVGGEKVNPADVEETARAVPGVLDACAFGLKSPTWGERVALYVQAAEDGAPDGATLETDLTGALTAALAAALPAHARPSRVLVSPEPVPRTATGKILRGVLMERVGSGEGPGTRG